MSSAGTALQAIVGSGKWRMVDNAYVCVASNSVCTFDIGTAPNLTSNPPVYGDTAQQIRHRRWFTKRPTTNEVLYSIGLRHTLRRSNSSSSSLESSSKVVIAVEHAGGNEDMLDADHLLDAKSTFETSSASSAKSAPCRLGNVEDKPVPALFGSNRDTPSEEALTRTATQIESLSPHTVAQESGESSTLTVSQVDSNQDDAAIQEIARGQTTAAVNVIETSQPEVITQDSAPGPTSTAAQSGDPKLEFVVQESTRSDSGNSGPMTSSKYNEGSDGDGRQQQQQDAEEGEHTHRLPSPQSDSELGSDGEPSRGRTRQRGPRQKRRARPNPGDESPTTRQGCPGLRCGKCTVI